MPQTAEAPPQRAAERGETPARTATMRAVVCHGPQDYRLEQVPVPKPGPDEILTQVERVGICMGDIKTFRGAPSFWGCVLYTAPSPRG